ncbi:MAG: transposase [Rhodanobacter sp.]
MWEGRYKSCLVDSETCVLSCYRYIELNPVRARMIDDPVQFLWSSCAANCGHRDDPLLRPHIAYTTLGGAPDERATAYQTLLRETLSEDDLHDIRIYLQQQRALGRDDFRAMVEAKTHRFAGTRPAHRPARAPSKPADK